MKKEKVKWQGHSLLGRKAFEMLPDWEKSLIKPDMSREALNKSYMPSGINTPGDKMAFMCLILDFIYYDEFKRYATLADGRWIPHTPADASFSSSVGSGQPISNSVNSSIIEMLMNNMIIAIKKDDWEEAICHGGALGHFIQEPFTPGHAVDNNIFHELFPDPDEERHMRLHYKFDCASDKFESFLPWLMGLSVQEAVFRIIVEMQKGIKEGKKLIMPLIMSVYQGAPLQEQERILAEQSGKAAYLTACVWHTAISIAKNNFVQNEVEKLTNIKLTEIHPYFWHECDYVDMLPGYLVEKQRKIPIYVWEQNTNGSLSEKLIKDGFGMGGHMGVKFFVNGNIYKRFSCQVGLASRHVEGQDEHTNTIFSVEIDSTENAVYSEDMEYKAERIFETRLMPGKAVKTIDIDITGAQTLILCARSFPYKDEFGRPAFSIPHIAVCEPILYK
jgi:NPCBM/NEW2 domain-containing protein